MAIVKRNLAFRFAIFTAMMAGNIMAANNPDRARGPAALRNRRQPAERHPTFWPRCELLFGTGFSAS